MRKIVISTTSFGQHDYSCIKLLKDSGLKVIMNLFKRKISSNELIRLAKDAIGLIAGTEQITSEVLGNLKRLKVISRCGSGLDNIDLKIAKKMGIKVFNTPLAPISSVSELTLGLILSSLRHINLMDTELKKGVWDKKMGELLSGKKIGIIGFGRIGKRVARLLKTFGCEIAYNDIFVKKNFSKIKKMSKNKLLKWADIITIHVSNNELIIGEKEMHLMKKGALIINTSRGGLIDENALYKLLKNKYLGFAALDVFASEPYKGRLRELNNIILTPHIGSYAKETRIEMEKEAVINLLKGLNGG